MKLVKVIAGSVIFSLVLAFALAITNYTPQSERNPDTYYFSIMESFTFSAVYLTPILVVAGLIAYLIYILLRKRSRMSKSADIFTSIAASVTFVTAVICLFIFIERIERKNNVTNDIYLIPEGYTGDVFVFYNVEGAPPIETEEDFEVHTINEDGYFVTSTPDMDYGTVTDRYYYVDESGNRTAIDSSCVYGFGTGSTESDGYSIIFTGFQLTKTQCGQEFVAEGLAEDYDESRQSAINQVLKQYYGIEQHY